MWTMHRNAVAVVAYAGSTLPAIARERCAAAGAMGGFATSAALTAQPSRLITDVPTAKGDVCPYREAIV